MASSTARGVPAPAASAAARPARWTAATVLALAPDDSARKAAAGLAKPASWSGTGATADLVWGEYAGSGKNPYQVIVELAGPAWSCSCPSRKLPCKHVLGLLLTWSNGDVPDQGAATAYARAWADARQARAEKAAARQAPTTGTPGGEGDGSAPGGHPAGAAAAVRVAGARRAQRAERVASGLSELEEWLRDQVRVGIPVAPESGASATSAGRNSAGRNSVGRNSAVRGAAGGHADAMAARMNDAQAPGVAGLLRDLSLVPRSGEGWPGRLLAGYAELHLLARAHERLGELPPGLAATVRSRIGYPTASQEVLARPAVPDRWLVTGVRDLPDATVPTRRIWLRGRQGGRWAMLLAFAAPGGSWNDPGMAMLTAGAELDAALHYYPGEPPLRALIGARQAAPPGQRPPTPAGGVAALLADWSAAVAADPWLPGWPALLAGTPVAPPGESGQWHLVDAVGAALPIRYSESLWTLLAISGGHPVTIAGELEPAGLTALTAWHGIEAVAL
jgi:hypothetical protein